MPDQDAGLPSANDLLYTLVRIGDQEGVLSGVRPDGTCFLRQQGGHEVLVRGNPQRVELTCSTCHLPVAQRLYAGLCADCERARAAILPKPRETCEECGALGAYYSPGHKRWRCAQCHAQFRSNTGLFVESRVRESLAGDRCKGQHIDDPRHQWIQMKASRFHCRLCKSKTFEVPASFSTRQEMEDDVEVED